MTSKKAIIKTVQLRIYKPLSGRASILKDENGKVTNENQKHTYNPLSMTDLKIVKNLPTLGFFKYEIEKVYDKERKEVKNPDLTEIRKYLDSCFNPVAEGEKTTEEENKELKAELKKQADQLAKVTAMLEKLTSGGSVSLETLRSEYKEKTGKEPHNSWGEDKLKQELNK